MKNYALWIAAVFSLMATVATASEKGVSANGAFYGQPPTAGTQSIRSSSLDTPVIYYLIKGSDLSSGEHLYRCRIFDGNGKEAFSISFNVSPVETGEWTAHVYYTPNKARDAAGTWWFASELDDKPFLSQSIEVAPAARR